MNTMGVNTSTVVRVEASTAGQTRRSPATAAPRNGYRQAFDGLL
jgi:hypothetical protein